MLRRGRRSPPLKRRLALVLLFLLGFGPLALLMGALVPWPNEYGVRAKWSWCKEHKADYDAVFVGSSVTSYGVVPPSFDRELAARGHVLSSFNLGIGGMTRFEADHMVRSVLAEAPANLKYIFIEVSSWSPQVFGAKKAQLSPRQLYWHTPQMTIDALQACLEAPAPRQGRDWRMESARIHVQLMLDELTGKSQGGRTVSAWLGLDQEELLPSRADLAALHGYIDLDHISGPEWDAWRAEFLGDLEGYTKRVSAIPAGNDAPINVEGHDAVRWFEKQIETARAAGVEPIFYFGPYAAPAPVAYRLHEAGVLPVFLAYNRPDLYPKLYRFENRFDENHLNRRGAEAFTELLAEGFADHLEREGAE